MGGEEKRHEPDGWTVELGLLFQPRELAGAGLLHDRGGFVVPSRAALYFERLEAA